MGAESTIVSNEPPEEPDVSAHGMRLLTGGLTQEGDTFLLGAGAVLLMGLLYPLVGVWAMLAFIVVPIVAVLARARLRKRAR